MGDKYYHDCKLSLAEADLEAVIIEFAGELVVVFPLKVVELVCVLLAAEQLRQILLLSVNLELVEGFAFTTIHIVVRVNVLLGRLQLVVH